MITSTSSRRKLVLFICVVMCIFVSNVSADCPNNCYEQWDQGSCTVVNSTYEYCTCTFYYTGDDCSANQDVNLNWDMLQCNGGRWFPSEFYNGWQRYCVCPFGWEGFDCSICMNNDSCRSRNKTYCDNSVYVSTTKYYNCSVTDQGEGEGINNLIQGQGSVVATANFLNNSQVNGNATLSFFSHGLGIPRLFDCNFTGCTVQIDNTGTQTIACTSTQCNVTSWASPVLTDSIEGATGWMKFICSPNGACQWQQDQLSSTIPFIPLQCTAGECTGDEVIDIVITPPDAYNRVFIILGIGLGIFIAAIPCMFGTYKVLKIRRMYTPLPHIEATLSFHNISCSIPQKGGPPRPILYNVNGAMLPGSVTAIMGASGAGKTTFLDILARRKNTGIVRGEIFINGEPCSKSFKRLVGYVTQDDVFLGTLTVREYLRYIALLRLPAHMTYDQKMRKVDESLHELGISHIANSTIGTTTSRGISGGERKRLAIAAELVVDPSILLLDEPTSGLDSYSASSLIQTLQNLAHGKNKRTIVMSIHQPRSDIYHMFDYLMVFAAGHVVYFGEGQNALSHFSSLGYRCPPNFNPADFIIDTISKPTFNAALVDTPKISNSINAAPVQKLNGHGNGNYNTMNNQSEGNVVNANGGTPLPHVASAPPLTRSTTLLLEGVDEYAASFFTQFSILTRRTMVHALRNPFLFRIQYLVFITVGLLLGYLYWHVSFDLQHGGMQNRMGSLFFICTLLSFAAISSIDLFYSERLLFLRERANGCYRTSAYFLSKAVSDLIPMRLLPPLILGSIVYYMIGYQPAVEKFLIFLFTLVVLSMTATSMCFLISSLAPSIAVANFVAILLLFFFLLFGGFLVSLPSMPVEVRWITNLSFLTFSYTILMVNEFNGISILINPDGMTNSNPVLVSGRLLLTQVGMKVEDLYRDMWILCGMLGFYMVATYLVLRFVVKEKR